MIILIKVTTNLNHEENKSIEILNLIFINHEENKSIEILKVVENKVTQIDIIKKIKERNKKRINQEKCIKKEVIF